LLQIKSLISFGFAFASAVVSALIISHNNSLTINNGRKHGAVAAACRRGEAAGVGVPAGQVQAGEAGAGRRHAGRAVRTVAAS
jgi:hypothetical protein